MSERLATEAEIIDIGNAILENLGFDQSIDKMQIFY